MSRVLSEDSEKELILLDKALGSTSASKYDGAAASSKALFNAIIPCDSLCSLQLCHGLLSITISSLTL